MTALTRRTLFVATTTSQKPSNGRMPTRCGPDIGWPPPDQGYGIHLGGGSHARIAAPYILHSEQTGDYYLLLTFGGLDASGW